MIYDWWWINGVNTKLIVMYNHYFIEKLMSGKLVIFYIFFCNPDVSQWVIIINSDMVVNTAADKILL